MASGQARLVHGVYYEDHMAHKARIKAGAGEREARRQHLTPSALVNPILKNWVDDRLRDDAEQERLHAVVMKFAGTMAGGDPHASEKVSEIVRARIMERYKQGRL